MVEKEFVLYICIDMFLSLDCFVSDRLLMFVALLRFIMFCSCSCVVSGWPCGVIKMLSLLNSTSFLRLTAVVFFLSS
jgi:hypothetical protein